MNQKVYIFSGAHAPMHRHGQSPGQCIAYARSLKGLHDSIELAQQIQHDSPIVAPGPSGSKHNE